MQNAAGGKVIKKRKISVFKVAECFLSEVDGSYENLFLLVPTAKAEATTESFTSPPPQPEPVGLDPESDVELDLLEYVVTPDTEDSLEVGDDNKEEDMDQAIQRLRGKAAKGNSSGEFEGLFSL